MRELTEVELISGGEKHTPDVGEMIINVAVAFVFGGMCGLFAGPGGAIVGAFAGASAAATGTMAIDAYHLNQENK